MPIILCPQCESELEIDAESAGASVQCGSCNHVFTAGIPTKKSARREPVDAPFQRPSKRLSRDEEEEDDSRRSPTRRSVPDDEEDYERAPRNRKPQGGNGMGIASMVCGIVGLVGSCCCILFPVIGIVGIVLGILSLKTPGKGMGITGIICGSLSIVLLVISLIFSVGMNMANFGAAGAGNPPAFRGVGR